MENISITTFYIILVSKGVLLFTSIFPVYVYYF